MPVLRTVLPNLVTLHIAQRDLGRARVYLERGMRLLRSVDNPATHAALHGRLAELEMSAGHLGAALAAARQSIARYEANGGGSQDYGPWILCGRIFEHADAGDRSAALFEALLRSPARAPGPGPEALVRLNVLAARVPRASGAEALALADELQALREAPDAAYGPTEADFWRAFALQRAGRPAEGLAVADALPEGELGLLLHTASLCALRLQLATAAGVVTAARVAEAEAAWASAPPMAALELASALAPAQRALGATASADHWAGQARRTAEALADSLEGEPELALGLLRRWLPRTTSSRARGLR